MSRPSGSRGQCVAKTLLQLRTAARQRSDQEGSTFITDAELNAYINASYAELYDLLISKFEDYFTTQEQFQVSGRCTYIDLPDNFYKLRGLDIASAGSSSDWSTVPRYEFAERNSAIRSRLSGGVAYNILGAQIQLLPASHAAGTYRLWFVPRFTPLVSDADEMGDVLDFDEYVVVDAAIKCLIKEESDPSALMNSKLMLINRVNTMAASRDSSGMGRVADVRGGDWGSDGFFPY